jgi:hypothetical protein
LTQSEPQKARRSELLKIFAALSIGKLAVFASALYAFGPGRFLFSMSTRWDSAWIQAIAQYGYTNPNVAVHSPTSSALLFPNAFAFSPFYPSLTAGLASAVGSYWVSALLIPNALSFVVPYVLYRAFGFRVALLAEMFPTYLVFTTIPYSEALTVLFLALAIALAMRQKVFSSSAAVSLGVLSAFNAAFVLPSFVLAFARNRRRTIPFFVLPVVAGLLILAWFQIVSGSYSTYFGIEATHWHVSLASPFQQAAYLLQEGTKSLGFWPIPGGWLTRNLPFEAFYVLGVLLFLLVRTENRGFLGAFSLSVIVPLFFVVGGPALSVPRLLLPAFPVFVSYSYFIKGRVLWLYCALCVLLTVWVALSQFLFFFA